MRDPNFSVLPIFTMIPTPGMSHGCCNSNSRDPPLDYFMSASTDCDRMITDSTNHSGFLQDGSFSSSNGFLLNGYKQGVVDVSIACDGKDMLSPMGIKQVASEMGPSPEQISFITPYSNGVGFSNTGPFDGGHFSTGGSLQYSSEASFETHSEKQHLNLGELILMKYRGYLGINQNVHPMDFPSALVENSELPSNLQFPQRTLQEIPKVSNISHSRILTPSSTREDLLQFELQMLKSRLSQLQPHQPYVWFDQQSEVQSRCFPVEQDKSCSQIAWQNAYQQPQLPSEQSYGVQHVASASSALPFSSNGAARRANSSNLLQFSVELKRMILLSYINYKSSPVPIGESQVPFVKYMHSTVCNGHTCNCDQYCVLVSHFDSCHYSDCHICGPARRLCVTDKLIPGLRKPKNGLLKAFNGRDSGVPSSDTSEDILLPSKRLKMENPFCSFSSKNRNSRVLVPSIDQLCAPEELPYLKQWPEIPAFINSDVTEVNTELFRSPIQDATSTTEIRNDVSDNSYSLNSNTVSNFSEELIDGHKQDVLKDQLRAPEELPYLEQWPASPAFINSDVTEVNTELFRSSIQDATSTTEIRNNVSDNSYSLNSNTVSIFSEELIDGHKQDILKDQLRAPEELPYLEQWPEIPAFINSDVTEVNTELFRSSIQDATSTTKIRNDVSDNSYSLNSNPVSIVSKELIDGHKQEEIDPTRISEIRNDVTDNSHRLDLESVSVPSEELFVGHKEEKIQVRIKFDQAKPEIKSDFIAPVADYEAGTKSEKPKTSGVSLTEFFTAEQMKEHISSLRQWIGQSISKKVGGDTRTHSVNENSCQLCATDKLSFAPSPLYCSCCGARIKRSVIYYCTLDENAMRHCFCTLCYRESRGGNITFSGFSVSKAKLEKKRNDEETEESWVRCDKCEGWQHQICALFNDKRDLEGKAEYICPKCYLEEIETGERVPLLKSAVFGAKGLPNTVLGNHIEQRLFRRLKQEREERAKAVGKNLDEVPGAADLAVRVVLSVDKKLKVKKQFLDIFHDENYPEEFPYRSKVILLFQKIEGVDVCLFVMYVQEFGSECSHPNQRCVYISYLDSVKFFWPDTETVTGEALRTFVYHEILLGYLDYCKKRGFATCYIWACPPLKGEDYILHCHPEVQKTPKCHKLRQWYQSMLRKAAKEKIVVNFTNLYDHFFVPNGECNTKITAARLPYFDGDYWSSAAEDLIRNIEQECGGELQRKVKKLMTKTTLKAMGHTNSSGDATKDIILTQKLGQTILPLKEYFIVVHLHFVCTHCHEVILSGRRWFCNLCKNFQLCERCHDAEQNLSERNAHTSNSSGEKHLLSQVVVNDVPFDTEDKDVMLDNGLFENRHTFLSFCQENHYQFDTLRRAKHSSMMILHHLHNPTVLTVGATCNICYKDIMVDQSWQCEICPEFDVCATCYQRTGDVCHIHKLTQRSSTANRGTESKEAWQQKALQTRELLDVLLHASQCHETKSQLCSYPNCLKIRKLFLHAHKCNIQVAGGCQHCKKAWFLLSMHSRKCRDSGCSIPRCMDLKKRAESLALQSETRQRAAVAESVSQQAPKVAENSWLSQSVT